MKLLTLNLWNYQGNWPARRSIITDLITSHSPDAVLLQETRHDFRYAHGVGQAEQIGRLTHYQVRGAVSQVYVPVLRVDEGLASLTRLTPLRSEVRALQLLPDERADENRRICLALELQINGLRVCVFNTHFSLSARARVSNAHDVLAFAAEFAGDLPSFLMGDLNAEPHEQAIRDLLSEDTGWTDCWASSRPSEPGFTYPSWGPVRRIDYVLARNVDPRHLRMQTAGESSLDGHFASDHLGILTEYDPP